MRVITGHGCSSKDDISKEIPTKPGSGHIFKDLFLQSLAGYPESLKNSGCLVQ
jgi:hypothetical protein